MKISLSAAATLFAAALLALLPHSTSALCPPGSITGPSSTDSDCSECPAGYVAIDGSFCGSDPALCPCDINEVRQVDGTCVSGPGACSDGYIPNGNCGCIGESSSVCTTDVKECSGGYFVSRDPENDCAFRSCPVDDSGSGGDPHVKTWRGDYFDYHGECDLVLLHTESFDDAGQDLDLHIRTRIRREYSFIESAGLRIGADVLEISSWGEYALNDVVGDYGLDEEGGNKYLAAGTLSGYAIYYEQTSEKEHRFEVMIDGANDEKIVIKTFKDLVNIQIHGSTKEHFGRSRGLMGSYNGQQLSRDGTKDLSKDPNAFGQEWQVSATEPMLFRNARAPQAPMEKCRLPIVNGAASQSNKRRKPPRLPVPSTKDLPRKLVCTM